MLSIRSSRHARCARRHAHDVVPGKPPRPKPRFGSLLVDKPLMQNVLADLAVESEAATVLAVRLAAAVDDLRALAARHTHG